MSSDGKQRLVEPLTEREQEVLQFLAQGMSNRQMADELVLSLNTVKWHNRQIYGKLGVENRKEAVARARELGLVAEETQAEPRHTLPLQLSSFVGRKSELAEVKRLLSVSRLVTLTGAGGCGKTRLALRAAHSVAADFPDGVWLVELAPLSDAALVPQAVAAVFDVREYEGRPILSLLQSYLRRRKLLLVLDNCEHVVEAAARLAESLLSHCPQLRILATSREALSVTGEAAWPVPTLSLPEAGKATLLDTLKQSDAIQLFVERTTAVLPGFSLTGENAAAVEQVCRRLDGIPLAIELAAARVKLLRVEQIAARLDDRFQLLTSGSRAVSRHQTLEALIDWSYELLAPAEQRLLRWLSVFAGGFTLEAVEAVCAGDDDGDLLQLLAQLVSKSLVVAKRETGQEARYHLLDTIRQYAWGMLGREQEAESAQNRHLDYFLQLAETAEPLLHSGEQLVWLERLEAEHDNLRAALAWSLEEQGGDLESGLRLATALAPFWLIRNHFQDGRRWLDVAIEKSDGSSLPIRARLLCNAGRLWLLQPENNPTALLQDSLALYRQLEDIRGIAASLCWLGFSILGLVGSRHDPVAAARLLEEGLALASQLGDRLLMTWSYHHLAWLALFRGDTGQAAELCAKGLALAEESGDRVRRLSLLYLRGRIAQKQRNYARAITFYRKSLVLAREVKERSFEARILISLGEITRAQGAYEEASTYYHESLVVHRETDLRGGDIALHNLGLVALARGDRRQARSLFRASVLFIQEKMEAGPQLNEAIVWNVWGLARVALAEGQPRLAVQLFAVAELEMKPGIATPVDVDDYERELALVRAELGEEAFAAAWAEGQAMSLEEAVALALEI